MEQDANRYAVQMKGISKYFGSFCALDQVDLEVQKGTVHALLGENGAGKSTLMNVLYGLYQAEEGQILINGKPAQITSPNKAIELGIGMVHQHFMLVEPFTVAQNIILGSEKTGALGTIDTKAVRQEILELSEKYGLLVDPDEKIEDISVGMQQRVEILKALYRGVDILILDEPTAVLTPQEIHELIEIMHKLVADGKTIIIITHKLGEIKQSSDWCTIIRRGQYIDTVKVSDTTEEELASKMVGRAVNLHIEKGEAHPGEEIFRIEGLTVSDSRGIDKVKNLSLSVRRGEILGLAGLVGAGRTETMLGVFGATKITSGEVWIKGRQGIMKSPQDSIRHGVALLPENRKTQGLILSLPVKNNIDLPSLRRLSKWLVIDRKADDRLVEKSIEELAIKTPSKEQVVMNLSGGNQQKVVVAKWMGMESDILIFDEPTKGIDVSAKQEIYHLLCALAEQGKAVILISSDMEEIMGISDRIAVFYEGTVWGELKSREEFDEKKIMQYASGIK